MEPTKFDELTKALATSTSRRQALKTIAATTLGSILGLGGIGTAFAKCHPNGHNCSFDSQCCSGLCHNHKCVAQPTTTTTTTLPPGNPYSCNCIDGTSPSTCNQTPCSPESVVVICTQLCASNGGVQSGSCTSSAC